MGKKKVSVLRDWIVLTLALVLTVAAGFLVPSLHIDNSLDIFLPDDNEVAVTDSENEEIFGSQDVIMVALSSRYESMLTPEHIRIVRNITEAVEKLPHVHDVLSISSADYIINSEWGMEVVNLYPEDLPEEDAAAELERRLSDWKDVYSRTLISDDLHMSSVIVRLEPGGREGGWYGAVYSGVRRAVDKYSESGLEFAFAGEPVLMEEIERSIVQDLSLLIPVSTLIICIIMFLTFHRLEGVVFPLISLASAVIITMGLMSLTGSTFTIASMLIPILLLVVGSAYCIHIMAHFYDTAAGETGFVSPARVSMILSGVIKDIRISVMMAGFTTVAGFISLVSSPLGPFKSFALLTAVGVAFTLLTAFVLLPALLRVRYRKGIPAGHFPDKASDGKGTDPRRSGRVFRIMGVVVRKGKLPVLLTIGLLIAVTASRIPSISTGMNLIGFFPESSAVRRDIDRVNDSLSGTGTVTVRFDAPEKGEILDPEFLTAVERFSEYMQSEYSSITAVSSLVPQVKRMNRLLNFDTVPYAVTEPSDGDFSDFFNTDLPADGDSSIDLFSDLEGTSQSYEGTSSGSISTRDEAEGTFRGSGETAVKDRGLTYEQAAEYLELSLLESGMAPDAETLVQNFLKKENFRGAAFNEIPSDPSKYGLESREDLRNLLAQYMVLYSGSLDSVVNDGIEPDKMLLTMTVNNESNENIESILRDTGDYWNLYIPDNWKYHVAGSTALMYRIISLITQSQIISVLIALVIVYIILAVIYRSFVAGFIGLIPVLAGLTGIFFTMSVAGFNLDFITALLGSLAIGIGVDYAIHFISAYRRAVLKDEKDTLDYVYRTTGRAIFFNAVSVAAGFLALVFSSLIPIRQLGMMFALAMVFSGGASLIIVPMVLQIFNPRFLYRGTDNTESP